jgi:hypothetical protein
MSHANSAGDEECLHVVNLSVLVVNNLKKICTISSIIIPLAQYEPKYIPKVKIIVRE